MSLYLPAVPALPARLHWFLSGWRRSTLGVSAMIGFVTVGLHILTRNSTSHLVYRLTSVIRSKTQLEARMDLVDDVLTGRRTSLRASDLGEDCNDAVEALLLFGVRLLDSYSKSDIFLDTERVMETNRVIKIFRAADLLCPAQADRLLRLRIQGQLGRALCWREMTPIADDSVFTKGEGEKLLKEVISELEPSEPFYKTCINCLATQYHWATALDIAMISVAISYREQYLGLCSEGDMDYVEALIILADDHLTRQGALPNVYRDDIDKAVSYSKRALNKAEGDLRRRSLLVLASAIRVGFERTGAMGDMDQVILLYSEAIQYPFTKRAEQAAAVTNLAAALLTRWSYRQDREDLDRSVTLLVDLANKSGDRPDICLASSPTLIQIGMARFTCYGEQSDLNSAIFLCHRVIDTVKQFPFTLPGPFMTYYHYLLATALKLRYGLLARQEDIDEAIYHLSHGCTLLPPGYGGTPLYSAVLGQLYLARYEARGLPDDLDVGVRIKREYLNWIARGIPRRTEALQDLSSALNLKALTSDTQEAVVHLLESAALGREAITENTLAQGQRLSTLLTLGWTLTTLYTYRGRRDDLTEAESKLREAGQLASGNHQLSVFGLSLAKVLALKYDALRIAGAAETDTLAVLDEGIILLRQIMLGSSPEGSIHAQLLQASAALYRKRWDALQHQADLAEMVTALQYALSVLKPESPSRVHVAMALVRGFCLQAMEQGSASHLRQSTADTGYRIMREALNDLYYIPRHTLKEASEAWGDLISLHIDDPDWTTCLLELAQQIVSLLPKVAYLGLGVQARLRMLREGQGVSGACAAYALAQKQPSVALELLEHGRGTFWSQALQLRTEFNDVPENLRVELQSLARQLDVDTLATISATGNMQEKKIMVEGENTNRRHASEKLEACVKTVRKIPSLSRFMLPPLASALLQAAAKGPVVVVLCNENQSYAIVLDSPIGNIQQVSLPDLNARDVAFLANSVRVNQLSRAAKRKPPTIDCGLQHLETLWRAVVHPIFRALNMQRASGRDRKRIFWCPTGQFAFLPLHAAGNYTPNQVQCCSDFAVSSFTPTLTALIKTQRSSARIPTGEVRAMLAAEPRAPGMPYLGGVLEEVEAVALLLPKGTLLPPEGLAGLQPEPGVTIDKVAEYLPEANIVHLACHGVQETTDALESGFCLRDGRLTVRKLMAFNLQNATFAFCSACETAKGDSQQPDQTVHLAAAMLFAGFKSVVATMWVMNDSDGPRVARGVYRELLKGEFLDLESVPYALDAAMRQLRAGGVSPSRWAPYIHLGC